MKKHGTRHATPERVLARERNASLHTALSLGLLAFFLAWQYLSFTIALFGTLGILVAAATAERHGLISDFLLRLRTPISFGRTGDAATGHSQPRFAVVLSNISFVELAAAGVFIYFSFDDYSVPWSPIFIGIIAFWVAWRINLLRSLGVIFLLRNFFKGIGLVLSLLLIKTRVLQTVFMTVFGLIWLLGKLRVFQLLAIILTWAWRLLRVTRIYWVIWLPFWLMFRGAIKRNRQRTAQRYENLFALSRVTDPAAVEYLKRVGRMHWGLETKVQRLRRRQTRLLDLLQPAQAPDEGQDGVAEDKPAAEENPFAAGNKLALMSEFERAQYKSEQRRQEQRDHADAAPTPSHVARAVRQLGRRGRRLVSEADDVLNAAGKLEVPSSHKSFHYEWTDGVRQLQHAGQEFSRVAVEYEARISSKVTTAWSKDTPFDPHMLNHANRLLERGLEQLADATAMQREMVGVPRPKETVVSARSENFQEPVAEILA